MNLDLTMLQNESEVAHAKAAFQKRNGEEFAMAGYCNGSMMNLVLANDIVLLLHGMYESAVIAAYTGCKLDYRSWPLASLERMFQKGNRKTYAALGTLIPEKAIVYRGLYRQGAERQVRGFSWTTSLDVACWYALRGLCANPQPAIYQTTVRAEQIICSYDQRKEKEIICFPPKGVKLLKMSLEEMQAAQKRTQAVFKGQSCGTVPVSQTINVDEFAIPA